MAEPPTHRKHSTWTSKFGTKQRLQLASLTRLAGISRPARSRCALFQDLKTSERFSERFAADKPFDQILRDVAAHFGYAETAQFYIADQHGDLRPVSSADELAKAFASWESSSGPRMRAKLASVVDETLEKLRSPDAERQLLGVLAAWELACEPASHERMDGAFFGALLEKLHSPHFAVQLQLQQSHGRVGVDAAESPEGDEAELIKLRYVRWLDDTFARSASPAEGAAADGDGSPDAAKRGHG